MDGGNQCLSKVRSKEKDSRRKRSLVGINMDFPFGLFSNGLERI